MLDHICEQIELMLRLLASACRLFLLWLAVGVPVRFPIKVEHLKKVNLADFVVVICIVKIKGNLCKDVSLEQDRRHQFLLVVVVAETSAKLEQVLPLFSSPLAIALFKELSELLARYLFIARVLLVFIPHQHEVLICD